jgi:uncharacterized protein (DUF2147 family)
MARAAWPLVALLFAGTFAGAVRAATVPEGYWLTQDHDGVIALSDCGAALCGRIVGMLKSRLPDGSLPLDPGGHPVCGLPILHVDPIAADVWEGRITNPRDGSIWSSRLSLDRDGTLHLRGFVLVPLFGLTHVWTRYNGKLGADCAMS